MERKGQGVSFKIAALSTGLSLGAAGAYMTKGLYISHKVGGLEHVAVTTTKILTEVQRFNINQAIILASHYPNEMSAILSFGIAAICGMATASSMLGYAYIEANNQD